MSKKIYTVTVLKAQTLKAQTGKFEELVTVLEELAQQTHQEAGAVVKQKSVG